MIGIRSFELGVLSYSQNGLEFGFKTQSYTEVSAKLRRVFIGCFVSMKKLIY
jgi:hypothetical protein